LQWYFSKRRTCCMRFLMSCCGYLSSVWPPLSKCFILWASYKMCFVFLDRFDLREENRKDVLRTLYALIDEANTANWSSHGQPLQSNTVAATSSWCFFPLSPLPPQECFGHLAVPVEFRSLSFLQEMIVDKSLLDCGVVQATHHWRKFFSVRI
jgi:hypothetical protein